MWPVSHYKNWHWVSTKYHSSRSQASPCMASWLHSTLYVTKEGGSNSPLLRLILFYAEVCCPCLWSQITMSNTHRVFDLSLRDPINISSTKAHLMRLCNTGHVTIESFGSWNIPHHPEATRMIASWMFLKSPNISTRKNVCCMSLEGHCLSQCDSYFELVTIPASIILIAMINKQGLNYKVAFLS